jgi:Protein of unknown function (DUF3613)
MDNKLIISRLAMVLVMLPSGVLAQEQAAPEASEIGHSTRALIALQREGTAAAPASPMLGDEATAAYARYLKSFNTAIPERLGSSVGEVSSGSSGSGSTGGQN